MDNVDVPLLLGQDQAERKSKLVAEEDQRDGGRPFCSPSLSVLGGLY